jgi:3-hydroxymyristoyl/3-hydroxydecanoyl-(acyl carrier protein) dehydratase
MDVPGDLEQLLPHRRPWLLIDRVLEVGRERVVAEKRVSAGDPLTGDGLSEALTIEALAQTAACVMGTERGQHLGYLVAVRGFSFGDRARAGETLILTAEKQAALGALHRFIGEARVGGRVMARGELTFSVVSADSATDDGAAA